MMKQFDWTVLFRRPLNVFTQLVAWLVIFFLYILLKEYPQRMSGATLVCLVLQETLELAIPCYAQNLLILPLFKQRRWLTTSILYLVQLACLVLFLPYVLNTIGYLFGALFHVTDLVDWRNEHIAFSIVAFTVIASLAKIAVDKLILEKERKENELRHLKAQLNPHFLFNTLNNFYGLAVAGSGKLPDLMLKLSDLLRYSLYDTNQQFVPLQKEVDYIMNYAALERIRLDSAVDIRLDVEGDFREKFIAPLLLIVLVENAFKHFSALNGEPAFVWLTLTLRGEHICLQVRNSVDASLAPVAAGRKNGGLGLENLRQRLRLIYPGQYNLSVTSLERSFETDLQIELT